MTTTTTHDQDEQRLRLQIADWCAAIATRDADTIVAGYAADIVLFDAIPPYKTVGRPAVRKAWADCLPHFPPIFQVEHRDLDLQVSGDLAVARFLIHFAPTPADNPCGETWMRVTESYARTTTGWQVTHSHVSIPFNPITNQAWFISSPDVVDQPDYAANPCPPGQP